MMKGCACCVSLLAAMSALAGCWRSSGPFEVAGPDADSDANTDGDTDSDADSDSDTDTDTGTDTDIDTNIDTDTDTDTDLGTDSDTDTATDTDSDWDAGTDTETDGGDGIYCGWGICDLPQVCCITPDEPYQECTDSDSCAGDLMVACDGPEDCGATGGECCLPSGAYSATYCVTGECMSTQAVCHDESDCDTDESCCPGVLFGWTYSVCQAGPCD